MWTRFTVLPLLALLFWSRAWLGWWCVVPVALSVSWMLFDPRVFSTPRSTNSWATKAVFGGSSPSVAVSGVEMDTSTSNWHAAIPCASVREVLGEESPGSATPLWAVRCKRRRAKHDSGPRKASAIRHVVVHSTEGGTAASVAAFFATTARASTQLVVDESECYRCVPDLVIPWGAPGVNATGLHIEHCGLARWTRKTWLAHEATLRRSAAKAALWCWRFDTPRRWLTVGELRAGEPGFCRHSDASRAFPTDDPHSDPGPGFPRDEYMAYVDAYYAEIRLARQSASAQ